MTLRKVKVKAWDLNFLIYHVQVCQNLPWKAHENRPSSFRDTAADKQTNKQTNRQTDKPTKPYIDRSAVYNYISDRKFTFSAMKF